MKLHWQQAPIRTVWGDDMVVASVAIDKDHTVCLYCEREQAPKVEAMFAQPAQPQQEPVAWWNPTKDSVSTDPVHRHNKDCQPLYTSPPAQRKPLTDEEIKGIYEDCDAPTGGQFTLAFTRAIEAAHGIKGDAA